MDRLQTGLCTCILEIISFNEWPLKLRSVKHHVRLPVDGSDSRPGDWALPQVGVVPWFVGVPCFLSRC